MTRASVAAAALVLALLAGVRPTAAAPRLYAYEGAGCSGVDALPQLEALLGHKVDGVVDFDDWGQGTANALATLNWSLGCWQGKGYRLATAIPLGFRQVSNAQIAAGAADAFYAQVGAALVAHGFADADIRLGHEGNGGWYPWGRQPAYATAFARAYRVLKATPGSHFTVLFNPAAGIEFKSQFPGLGAVDGMALDVYANTWNSGGATTEPGIWQGNLVGPAGVHNAADFHADLGYAIPEFGVGYRSDGHGAPNGDDPTYMAAALAYFKAVKVRWVGYWDFDAPDYAAKISSGERPHETLPFVQAFASPNMAAIFSSHAQPFAKRPAPKLTCTLCHASAFQTGLNQWVIVAYAIKAHPSTTLAWTGATREADLYDPSQSASPVKHLGAVNSATFVITPGKSQVVAVSMDGP